MALWVLVFVGAFCAEALGDILSVGYQTTVRKLQRGRAARWAIGLALLSWVDLSGIALRWPLTALVAGSVAGAAAGTYWAVTRQQIKARLKRKRKEAQRERDRAVAARDSGQGDQPRGAGG